MTTIKNITTNELIEIECIIDGTDILADVLGGSGIECDDEGWLLSAEDAGWWERWAKREEAISDAYADADESTRAEYERVINEFGYDMELLQDKLEKILGIC